MIKEVVLPQKIGGYYLFSKRVIGVEISKSRVCVTRLALRGKTCTITDSFSQQINESQDNYPQEVARVLIQLIKKCGSYDHITSCISGITPVVKEITLPFASHEKIKKIIRFEIESELPFPLENAVVDYVITKTGNQETETSVLIVAMAKKAIEEHRALFEQANLTPNTITIDMIALVSLFMQTPTYAQLTDSVALLDIGDYVTTIGYLDNGQLRRMRTLNLGLVTCARAYAQNQHISEEQARQALFETRFEAPDGQDPRRILAPLFTQIQFTLNSIALQINKPELVSHIILTGEGARISQITTLIKESLNAPSVVFDIQEVLKNQFYQKKHVDLRQLNDHMVSLSVAAPQILNEDFNLNKKAQQQETYRLFFKQLVVAGVLIITMLSGLIFHSFMVIGALKREALASEQEVMMVMQETFKIPEEEPFDEAVSLVNEQVTKEEKRWLIFSPEMRSLFLYYLQELSKAINRKELGLQLQKMSIDDTAIELQGSVKDFAAVNTLEADLRKTKLFVSVPDLENPNFETEPLRLTLKRKVR